MFIIKDPDLFAQTTIPTYFIHNKFSSFARQLNFYGFRKVSTKPIKNDDFDESTAKHVIFYNPSFMKGRLDLLPEIQRCATQSKSHSMAATASEEEEEIQQLKQRINDLMKLVKLLESDFEGRCALLLERYHQEMKALVEHFSVEHCVSRMESEMQVTSPVLSTLCNLDNNDVNNDSRYYSSVHAIGDITEVVGLYRYVDDEDKKTGTVFIR